MKMAVLWVVAPCSPVEVYRRFRGIRLHGATTQKAAISGKNQFKYLEYLLFCFHINLLCTVPPIVYPFQPTMGRN
jgi:hypothetical protein